MISNGKDLQSIKKRYFLLDSLRGITIVSMVVFHLCYDIFMINSVNTDWYFYPITTVWERSICVMFILISGMCLNFSRNGVKRGIIVNLAGFAVTVATTLVIPEQAIWFGVLNLIGCSMMIVSVLKEQLGRIKPLFGALASLALYAVLYALPEHSIGLFKLELIPLPDFMYSCKYLAFLGLPSSDFLSTDYFPLIPWIFLFTAGYFLWRFVYEKGLAKYFEFKIPVFNVIGRYSLWIYLIHQPVLFAVTQLF